MCYYCTVDSGNYPGGTSSHIVTEYILATTLQSHQLTDTIWTCPGLPDVKWIHPDVLEDETIENYQDQPKSEECLGSNRIYTA